MGDNWMLWLLPISGPSGDGLQWGIAEQKKSEAASEATSAATSAVTSAASSAATSAASSAAAAFPADLPARVPWGEGLIYSVGSEQIQQERERWDGSYVSGSQM